jgi:capsular exopolysaccharide synthesis family protein
MKDTYFAQNENHAFPINESRIQSEKETFSENESTFDVMRFLEILLIHKWLFLGVVTGVTLIAIFFAWQQPKYYETKSEIFYNESLKEFVIESNVPVIKSDFDKEYWLSLMKSDQIAHLIQKNSGLPYSTEIIKRMFKVEMGGKKDAATPVYTLTVTSKKADIIPILIKSFVLSLNDLLFQNQVISSQKLVNFLAGQLNDNNNKLSEIDRQIMQSNGGKYGSTRDTKKLDSDLEEFRRSLLNTQIDLSSAIASKKQTEAELKNLDGTIVNESSFSEPLKVQLMNLQVDLARALTKNKEDHPAIKGIRDNIAQINAMLRDSIQQKLEIKSLSQNPLKSQLMSKLVEFQIQEISLQTRALSLQKVIGEFEMQMNPDSTNENQQLQLRNRELVMLTINLLNAKLIEAQSAAQGSISRFVIIDEPETPTTASSKGKLYFLLIGVFVAILLGGAAVFVYDMLDNRIKLITDYEKYYHKIPILGAILSKETNESLHEAFENNITNKNKNEFGEIVLHLKQMLKNPSNKLIAICSPLRREGKTTISMELASALASKGLKTLLVDMDTYIPKLTNELDISPLPNLINLMAEECDCEAVLHPTSHPNLTFTGTGHLDALEQFYYDNKKFSTYLAYVRERFDVVIFDTPAVLYNPDIVSFLEKTDSIILIARLMQTNRKVIDKMLRLINVNKTPIAGTIVNGLKINKLNRYSDYNYYGYEYSYEYNENGEKQKTRKRVRKRNEIGNVA